MDYELMRDAVTGQVLEGCAKAGMISLGELDARLGMVDQSLPVRTSQGDSLGFPDSYRGYYSHIAIGLGNSQCTVAELRNRLQSAIGGIYTGFKGGEFMMTRMTPVWVADYGESTGIGIIGVEERDGYVEIVTRVVEPL